MYYSAFIFGVAAPGLDMSVVSRKTQ